MTATCTITWRMIVACITVYNLFEDTGQHIFVCVLYGGAVMTRGLVGLCLLGQPCMKDSKSI